MRFTLRIFHTLQLLLMVTFCLSAFANAQEAEASTMNESEIRAKLGVTVVDPRLAGVSLAEGVSQLTGVAISPLLGVSVVGAWSYFKTDVVLRDELPWVCNPWCWGTCFTILGLLCLNQFAPMFLRKPLQQLETLEDKLSALLAGTVLVPFIVDQVSRYQSLNSAGASANLIDLPLASTGMPMFAEISSHWFLLPIALVAFAVIWIVSHAFTILIALCPFPVVDNLLKIARLSLLCSIAVMYAISPVLAAIFSSIILLICAFIAPWAFRVTVFGTLVSSDFLISLFRNRKFNGGAVYGFLARSRPGGFKARCFGKVLLDEDGKMIFSRRWCLVGPQQRIELNEPGEWVIEKGFICPGLHLRSDDSYSAVVHFLPRYRYDIEELSTHFNISWRDTAILRGFRAAKDWVYSFFKRVESAPS